MRPRRVRSGQGAEGGKLRLSYEILELSADDNQQLYLPADATATALDALAGRRPGGLRAVAG